MSKAIDKIEKEYRLPCGPMEVSADSVCRRRLKDYFDNILDKLSEEIHPNYVKPENPKWGDSEEKKTKKQQESLEEKRKRMLAEGKVKVEVKKELKSYQEKLLEGNSKLLQDTTGNIEKR